MTTYARITLKPDVVLAREVNRRRASFILRVTRETDLLLIGIEVDAEGDEVIRRRADGTLVDETKHIICKGCIAKRAALAFNNTYGLLERVK